MDFLWGAIGGVMIGSAAALYLLVNGRIMGASGVLGGLVDGSARSQWLERGAFLLGLIAVPALISGPQASTNLTQSLPVLVAAGLCVGLGTRLANGCTSGHGVCGISRLSLRGIAATVCYLMAGAATLYVFRHLMGLI